MHDIPSTDHTVVPTYSHQHVGNQLSLPDRCVYQALTPMIYAATPNAVRGDIYAADYFLAILDIILYYIVISCMRSGRTGRVSGGISHIFRSFSRPPLAVTLC